MIPFLMGLLICLGAIFRSDNILGLGILAPLSSWAHSSENILALGSECKTGYFGFCSAVFGRHGAA